MLFPAPLGPTSGPPLQPEVEVKETAVTIRWTPPSDARDETKTVDPDVLPSRSLVPTPPASWDELIAIDRRL